MQRTRGISEIRQTIAAHVRDLIGEEDDAFTAELISAFRETVGALCGKAEAGYADGNTQAIAAAAHQIKGSAGNVGLRRVAHDWHSVEEAAVRNDPDLDRIVAESVATARHIVSVLEARPASARNYGRRSSDR